MAHTTGRVSNLDWLCGFRGGRRQRQRRSRRRSDSSNKLLDSDISIGAFVEFVFMPSSNSFRARGVINVIMAINSVRFNAINIKPMRVSIGGKGRSRDGEGKNLGGSPAPMLRNKKVKAFEWKNRSAGSLVARHEGNGGKKKQSEQKWAKAKVLNNKHREVQGRK